MTSDALPVERVLASSRAFLAVASLFAIWLDATEPSRFATLAYSLFAVYAFYSVILLIFIRQVKEVKPSFCLAVHAVDVLWPALISFFTTGPSSPFFIFYVFVLLEAAYRWGFLETLQTAEAAVALFLVQGVLMVGGPRVLRQLMGGEFELNRFIVRAVYLLIIGYLLGYLGEQERRLRLEDSATARIVGKVQTELSFRSALRTVLDEILRLTGSRRALLVVRNTRTEQAFLWEGVRDGGRADTSLFASELEPSQRQAYLIDPPGPVLVARRPEGKALDLVVLGEDGRRLRDVAWSPPESFVATYPFQSLLLLQTAFGTEFTGHLQVLDPQLGDLPENVARFFLKLGRQVSPAIYNVFLLSRLRVKAGAMERARVARELHDGVIQSLISLEMQMDVLRRRETPSPEPLRQELGHFQKLLHDEVLNLRELMQQMRPLDLGPRQFLDFLAGTVDRFRQDTGISARFVCNLDEVSLSPRVCNELARILQESLVNIRKHSQARNVLVAFDSQGGFWKLVVDDDGKGFDFSGRRELTDLDAARQGPMVIKERVRSIGGQLVVESRPGKGARLEVLCPQKRHG